MANSCCPDSLSFIENGYVLIARNEAARIIGINIPNDSQHSFTKEEIKASMDTMNIVIKERIPENLTKKFNILEKLSSGLKFDSLSRASPKIDSNTDINMDIISITTNELAFKNYQLAWAVQEIKNRASVNRKAYDLESKAYIVPIIGINLNLEDIGPVISIILLLMVYWLSSAIRRLKDTVNTAVYSFKKGESKADKNLIVRMIASNFFFIKCDEINLDSAQGIRLLFRHRAAVLIFAPYLIIISGILADVFDLIVMDYLRHNSSLDLLYAATMSAWIVMTVFTLLIAIAIFRITVKTISRFYELYIDIWQIGGLDVDKLPKSKSRIFPAGYYLLSSNIKKAIWSIALLPFVIFALFMALFRISDCYGQEYFLLFYNCCGFAWLYLLAVIGYVLYLFGFLLKTDDISYLCKN